MKKLILGATGSIGSALAKKIVNEGGQVHLVGREESSLSALASELDSTFTLCDVLEENFSEKIISDLSDIPINGLAYCVGSKDFLDCFNLNLISATEIIRATHGKLKENQGAIVLFSTVAAQKGFTNHSIISSAKAAVEGLTVALAAEFAPNVRINCIAPSLSKSKMGEFLLKNEKIAEGIAKLHPLKRLGQGTDFSSIAKFLISDESSWITGQIIGVDGGRSSIA
jgi:NAD(P)-dependent dehydrogenase (short-subunit alcohol dehydrogenase family)